MTTDCGQIDIINLVEGSCWSTLIGVNGVGRAKDESGMPMPEIIWAYSARPLHDPTPRQGTCLYNVRMGYEICV